MEKAAAPATFRSSSLPPALAKLLENAVINRAVEVLIEREVTHARIRQRIRGVLITDNRNALSALDMNEIFEFVAKLGEQKSEDGLRWAAGQLTLSIAKDEYSCRFLLSETKNFGLLTIHLTKNSEKAFNPTAWGMGPNQATILENFLARAHGLVLFCGTETDDLASTLQAVTKQLLTPDRHVINVSARSQAWLSAVEQLVSNNNTDSFTRYLKLAFRHEPDLVIANPVETKAHVDICLSEAVRGRLVFAQLFATDAADALLQFLGMGVEPYLVGAGLLGIVAQRTLRLNCQSCQDKEVVPRDRLKELNIPIGMQPAAFFHGKGCEACFKTGFDRETSIFEVLEMSDELRNKLQRDMKSEALRQIIKSNGLMTLRQMALHKAINGQTSLSEVLRVTT